MLGQGCVPVGGAHVVFIVGAGHAQFFQLVQHKVQGTCGRLAVGIAILGLGCGDAGESDETGQSLYSVGMVGVNAVADCFWQHSESSFLYVGTRRTVFENLETLLYLVQDRAVLEVRIQIFQGDLCDVVQCLVGEERLV